MIMRRMRLLALPFGAAAELSILLAAWCLALAGQEARAQKLHDWATTNLPTLDWYMGE